MKKLSKIISLLLIASFALSACSCSAESSLSFNSNFMGSDSSTPQLSYSETLTYNVYNDKSDTLFTKDSSIPSDFNLDFNGTYKVKFSVVSADTLITENVQNEINEDLINKYSSSFFYKLESTLNVTANYSFGTKEETKTDTIKSVVYFSVMANSYAPIYSEKHASYNILGIGQTTFVTRLANYDYSVSYGEKNYKAVKVFNKDTEDEETETIENKYTPTCLIDNEQLLFALRNFTIEAKSTATIPVVEPSYQKKTTLLIKNNTSLTENFDIIYNGNFYNINIVENNYTYQVNDTKAAGRSQLLFIQTNSDVVSLPYKSFITKYVHPIYEYNAGKNIGGLVYKLSEISIT